MPSKKDIQQQIEALTKSLETAEDEDDYERIEVKEDKEGNRTFGVRVKKSDPKWSWLFGEKTEDTADGDDNADDKDKKDPPPRTSNKFFGG